MADLPQPGQVFDAPFPFIGWERGEDGGWRLGAVLCDLPDGRTEWRATTMGRTRLTVVSTHKPGKFPVRVLYTQEWTDPDGNVFGGRKLRVTTAAVFRRRAKGFYHPVKTDDDEGASDG